MRSLVKADAEKWWPIIKEFGIKASGNGGSDLPPLQLIVQFEKGNERLKPVL